MNLTYLNWWRTQSHGTQHAFWIWTTVSVHATATKQAPNTHYRLLHLPSSSFSPCTLSCIILLSCNALLGINPALIFRSPSLRACHLKQFLKFLDITYFVWCTNRHHLVIQCAAHRLSGNLIQLLCRECRGLWWRYNQNAPLLAPYSL